MLLVILSIFVVHFDTDKLFTISDDSAWWPIRLSIFTDVGMPLMLNCSMRLCMTNVPWLQVLNCYYFLVKLAVLYIHWNHTHAKNIFSTNWFTLDVSTLAQLLVTDFCWCWELPSVVPSFFLYWKPCHPVECFPRQILHLRLFGQLRFIVSLTIICFVDNYYCFIDNYYLLGSRC